MMSVAGYCTNCTKTLQILEGPLLIFYSLNVVLWCFVGALIVRAAQVQISAHLPPN